MCGTADDDETGPKMASQQTNVGSKSLDKKNEKKKTIKFSNIQIREYERVVADNPSCTSGPPVGIGWKYGRTHIVDVNSYEEIRPSRRTTSRLILAREEREALLLNWGASFHDIVEAVRGNIKVKNQRRQTVVNIGKIERIEEAFEGATRKLKRALMLRRSTGDKVKRLQEQANLAQSALTSLKIAEDRALREIRSSRMIARQHIVEKDAVEEEGYGGNPIDVHPPSFSESDMIAAAQISTTSRESMGPKQQSGRSSSFDTLDHSTTPSEKELEKFYHDLELEMFGDEELPSMVGQTLEITVARTDFLSREESRLSVGSTGQTTVGWTDSGAAETTETEEKIDRYEIDEAALEEEMDRSMISQSLLENIEIVSYVDRRDTTGHQDTTPHRRLPLLNDPHIPPGFHAPPNGLSNVPDFTTPGQTSLPVSSVPLHLHAGMTMFQDCALLGGRDEFSSGGSGRRGRSRSSSRRDANAGPKIRHVPLPNHVSLTQMMDGDSENDSRTFTGWYDTVTINEDTHLTGSHHYYHH